MMRNDLKPEAILELQSTAPENRAANPKDIVARKKVSVSKLPFVAELWGSMAMMDGARKYGPYNWREVDVYASVYIDAAMRHLACWFEREEKADDSGVHHLGHVIACCAILLDAQAANRLIDDRPKTVVPISDILKQMSKSVEEMASRPIVKVDPTRGSGT
jgi:hypothetical protein